MSVRLGQSAWMKAGVLGTAVIISLGVLLLSRQADAKKQPAEVSRRCRKVMGNNVMNLTEFGLRQIAACQRSADRGRPPRPSCSTIETAGVGGTTSYGRAEALAGSQINVVACPDGDPALKNFPGGTALQAQQALVATVKQALGAGETMVQGLAASQSKSKGLARCRRTIEKARGRVVNSVLRKAVQCQLRIDRRSKEFGPLAPQCFVDAGKVGRQAEARIKRACRGTSGAAAGCCADLPGCVIQSAQDTAWTLARLTFPDRALCGNRLLEIGEGCDDGNVTGGDGCGPSCLTESGPGGGGSGKCGNGVVEGAEECDLGPNLGGDYNRDDGNCTTACKLAICGDGLLDTTEPGMEECDDAAQDECTDCRIDGKVCTNDGIVANVEWGYDFKVVQVYGYAAELAYGPRFAIPGTGLSNSVRARVTQKIASEEFFAADRDSNRDGVDDQVRMLVTNIQGPVPVGPIASIRFDCEAGTEVYPRDFVCTIKDPSDRERPLDPAVIDAAKVQCKVASLEGGAITTTTTTTTTSTTRRPATTTTTTTTTSTTLITCGNGVVDPPFEQCDDGNQDNNDDCLAGICQFNTCGDGFPDLQGPQVEECDDGNTDGSDGCTNGCTICGNRIISDLDGPDGPLPGETCDDGNRNETDFCPNDCRVETCVPTATEVTVTANLTTPNVAALTLFIDYPEGKVALLGSGANLNPDGVTGPGSTLQPFDFDHALRIVEFDIFNFGTTQVAAIKLNRCQGQPYPSEDEFTCALEGPAVDEDLNEVPGVTCAISVPPPTGLCGDGLVDPGEECDDQNANDEDDCLTTCRLNRCGDGVLDRQDSAVSGLEECDDGNTIATDGCTASCTICGNRVIAAPETCDDGNLADEDFCPADCQVDTCVPGSTDIPVTLVLNTPNIAALTLFLDYPEGKAAILGSGGSLAPDVVTGPASTVQPFDFDHALRIVEFDIFNFGTTEVATVVLRACRDAPAPAPEDFTCRLEGDAVDENLTVVPGVTCTVSGL